MKIVHQINVKLCTPGERGLPKKPVNRVFISKAGLEGDFNSFRTHKKDGDPDMAVLLYPLETIQELNDEDVIINPKLNRLFIEPSDLKILLNDFPYNFDNGIYHLCIWTKFQIKPDPNSPIGDISPNTRKIIERYLSKTFSKYKARQ